VSSERNLRLGELAITPEVTTAKSRTGLNRRDAGIPAPKGDTRQSLGQVGRAGDDTARLERREMVYSAPFLDQRGSRTRLSDLIGRRVRLVRRGREYVGLCPFHSEKTPSFYVVEDKGFFHCFGCGAHGDAINFVTRADNLSYAEAVERLAGDARFAGAKALTPSRTSRDPLLPPIIEHAGPIWTPILPVPDHAPALFRPDGRTVELINPKRPGRTRNARSFGQPPGGPTTTTRVACSATCCEWNSSGTAGTRSKPRK
jgi:hypothetical protein